MAAGAYVHHQRSLEHDTGQHPENASRIRAVEAALEARDWLGLVRAEAPAAERTQLERVHTAAHIDAVAELCARGGGMIDADTVASERSYEAALRAAGGAVWATERLLAGELDFALCALRPPGHHAESYRAMGFCLFNNVAVAAAHALDALAVDRVLILDWDVHHGNGTQEIFWESDRVLYASIHQSPLYPGTGSIDETGAGDGAGWTVNRPVPPGSGSVEFISFVREVVAPLIRKLEPGLVAVSAGFDAHRDDPLANCTLEEADYATMAADAREAAAQVGAPLLICLEGGYNIDALSASVVATVEAFGA